MARYLWTQKEDFGPAPRFFHAMAYDTVRGRVVLFGGDALGDGLQGDTWEWDGEFWTQTADTGPSPRRRHALCFDASRGAVLLFGGGNGQQQFGDTWRWDGENWTQLEDSGPAVREGHTMVFDVTRNRAVLFGGESAGTTLNDTWEWDGDAWTQQEDSGPSARKNHAMAFDLRHNNVVLFGGDAGTGASVGDTWVWNGTAWRQTVNFGANPRMHASMISTDVQVAMFGGITSSNNAPPPAVFRDTWVFDGRRWSQRQDIGPGPRWGHAAAFDSRRRRIVLFGGVAVFGALSDPETQRRLLGDTWEHTEDAAPVQPPPPPGPQPQSPFVSLRLEPNSARAGQEVVATITLEAGIQVSTPATLVFVPEGIFAAGQNNPEVFAGAIQILTRISIPPAITTFAARFNAPASAEPVVVLVATDEALNVDVNARLTILP